MPDCVGGFSANWPVDLGCRTKNPDCLSYTYRFEFQPTHIQVSEV